MPQTPEDRAIATALPEVAETEAPTPPSSSPPTRERRVTIAPGVVLEASQNGALLYTRDGQVRLRGDGAVNDCYFISPEDRKRLEAVLADEEAMARIRAYLREWGLLGKTMGLPYALSMNVPDEVQPGGEAVLNVGIFSNSDCPVEYSSGSPAFDFVVTRFDGTEVWRRSEVEVAGEPDTLRLGYREERAFEATWDLRDKKGLPLPEGAYWVHGSLNVGLVAGAKPEPYPVGKRLLFIGPRLLLTYWLDVWLEAPRTAELREPIPLVLKVRNRSNEPVQIFHGIAPFDFVILREDGTEVWRWSRWKVFPAALGSTTLQPGETLEHSATWAQYDQDCQPDPRIGGQPCLGNPVSPGKYMVRGTFEADLTQEFGRHKETVQVGPQELVIEP